MNAASGLKKVKFVTLGCRVNQYDTQGMREILENSGVVSAGRDNHLDTDSVDYVVINTCTVTGDADKTNRYWIRRSRRHYPKAKIIVTGCGVERNQQEIFGLSEVDMILMNHEKADIASRLLAGCASPIVQENGNPRHRFTPLSISHSEGKTRAFIKIQDGCNHACSFCKVVLARGRSRSRELGDIIDEVKRLRDSGYQEVVFVGIQLGAYGLDLAGKIRLADVLERTSLIQGIRRIRLSSIEPTDIQEDLIEALKVIPKCMPHLHIPLQSGDDEILGKMNRRYHGNFYRDLIAKLWERVPDFNFTLDVMAGFPGEGEDHFMNTCELIREVMPLRCHVFPYSARKGTRAFLIKDTPEAVKKDRVARLMKLSDELGERVRAQFLGKVRDVLVENPKSTGRGGDGDALLHGFTDNFMRVRFQGPSEWTGKIIPVKLQDVQAETFLGSPNTGVNGG